MAQRHVELTIDEWRRVRGDKECDFHPKAVQPFERFKAYHTVDWELVRDPLIAGQTPFAKEWRMVGEKRSNTGSECD